MLFTTTAVLVGLVYGFLPFMVLPLYAAIERIDWSLVEAGRDLYASGWNAFRRITWPLSRPGVIAGSVLVFIPTLGAYVTPEILGGARTTLLGSFVVSQFLAARNWPFGSALSVAILAVMLGATMVYFRTGGRTCEEGPGPAGGPAAVGAPGLARVPLPLRPDHRSDRLLVQRQPQRRGVDPSSLRWYEAMLQDDKVLRSLRNSLVVALVSTIVATVLGTGRPRTGAVQIPRATGVRRAALPTDHHP